MYFRMMQLTSIDNLDSMVFVLQKSVTYIQNELTHSVIDPVSQNKPDGHGDTYLQSQRSRQVRATYRDKKTKK